MTRSEPKRLLLVEDAPDIAAFLRLFFTPPRFELVVAEDLASARAVLARRPLPDLVILDIGLPDGDGLELCREIKGAPPAIPVLVLTAATVGRARRDALAAGADGFIPKPFDPDDLDAAVGSLLRGDDG